MKPNINNDLNLKKEQKENNIYYIAGYLAACTSISILYPFNKIIFRQQLYGIDAKVAFKQLQSEGFSFLFRGIL